MVQSLLLIKVLPYILGRLDQEAMQNLIKEHNVRLLIDASHPYAAIVTATAQDAAKAEGIPLFGLNVKRYHYLTMINCIS